MGKYKKTFCEPILKNNPVFVQLLGICSILAVTTTLSTALVMGLAVTFVTSITNFIISLIRKKIPSEVRLLIQMMIISSLVIIADFFIKAYFFEISKTLSIFVSLIITNCIVLGRAEAFAMKNNCILSFLDGLGTGLGYSLVIVLVGSIRELLGSGTLLGYRIMKQVEDGGYFITNSFMFNSCSVFFIIAILIWTFSFLRKN